MASVEYATPIPHPIRFILGAVVESASGIIQEILAAGRVIKNTAPGEIPHNCPLSRASLRKVKIGPFFFTLLCFVQVSLHKGLLPSLSHTPSEQQPKYAIPKVPLGNRNGFGLKTRSRCPRRRVSTGCCQQRFSWVSDPCSGVPGSRRLKRSWHSSPKCQDYWLEPLSTGTNHSTPSPRNSSRVLALP